MTMLKHIGIFASSGDVQTALNEGNFENPYVAKVNGVLDYNTLEQQSCEERGLCGDDPTNCHECTCEEQYEEGTQELCDCQGRYWWGDECHDEPEPEEPCAGMEQDIADCEGRGGTWDYVNCMCNEPEDPCQGDPECECNQGSGYNWWEDSTCHSCVDEWESLGYSSPEECACDKRGEDSGVCPEPICEEQYRGDDQAICECQGGTWDGENCNFNEGE